MTAESFRGLAVVQRVASRRFLKVVQAVAYRVSVVVRTVVFSIPGRAVLAEP
jgi:hypothetical protein